MEDFLNEILCNNLYPPYGLKHSPCFLGLTKGKSPNELDEQDKELKQEYLKNKEFKLFKNIKKISYNKTIYLY